MTSATWNCDSFSGSRLKKDVSKIYDLFFIAAKTSDTKESAVIEKQFPTTFTDDAVLQQSLLFCFPFQHAVSKLGHHFSFILTDIDGKHRFGFCKLADEGSKCYCILSFLPWFETFYKILNYIHEYLSYHDTDSLNEILENLHRQDTTLNDGKITISDTFVLKLPDASKLPSIPENINLSEYIAAVDQSFMLEIFTNLMLERRIVFTSSNLSTLTSSIHGAEMLMRPLHWQHIFVSVMPTHLLEYCLAPMPFLVGVHSSLMPKVRNMIINDTDIIIANLDSNEIETIHNDIEYIPSDVISYLKSALRKTNLGVGENLSLAFLRAQAKLIGSYRYGLKFHPGEPIMFDDDTFIESFKSSKCKAFARELVTLQTFKQFVESRLLMLNSGVGFRDIFEIEVNKIDSTSERDTYKEWLSSAKKGGNEFFSKIGKSAKGNMKSIYRAWKGDQHHPGHYESDPTDASPVELGENLERIRPSRPPPPNFDVLNKAQTTSPTILRKQTSSTKSNKEPPLRPPQPRVTLPRRSSRVTRKYSVVNSNSTEKNHADDVSNTKLVPSKEKTIPTSNESELNTLIDIFTDSSFESPLSSESSNNHTLPASAATENKYSIDLDSLYVANSSCQASSMNQPHHESMKSIFSENASATGFDDNFVSHSALDTTKFKHQQQKSFMDDFSVKNDLKCTDGNLIKISHENTSLFSNVPNRHSEIAELRRNRPGSINDRKLMLQACAGGDHYRTNQFSGISNRTGLKTNLLTSQMDQRSLLNLHQENKQASVENTSADPFCDLLDAWKSKEGIN